MSARLAPRLAVQRPAPNRERTEQAPAGLLGLEHEFQVVEGSDVRDFRGLLHQLDVAGARLDPGDPNAYRCEWGGAITTDGAEAEIATPPVPCRVGFTDELARWGVIGRDQLSALLPVETALDGFSTHLSAALPTPLGDRVARVLVRRFAPALMLMMDRVDSPGLLVRPRPQRVEVCGEYVVGSQLRAATAMVAGSVLASVDAVTRPRHARAPLPPRLTVTVTPAVERYGWYVDRGAFGADLYVAGRGARLRRRGGRSISAQEHLEAAWSSARDALAGRVGAADLEAADLVVSGGLPLPSEAPVEEALDDRAVGSSSSPFGAVLQERVRPGYRIRAEIATWSFTVFELRSTTTDRRGYVCIPLEWLDDFLEELDDGALDEDLRRFLVLGASGATLSSTEQTSEPGLYDRLGNPRDLLPRERDPITGSFSGGGSGGDRPGKERGRDHRRRPRRFGRILAVAGAAIVVLIVAAVVALAAGGGGDDETAKAAAAPSTTRAPATTRAPSTTRAPAATAPATTTELDPCSVLGDGDVSAAFGLPFTRDQSPDFCSFSRPSGGDFFVEASARRSSSVDGAKRSFEQARQVENVLPGGSNNVQPLAGVGDEAITNTECCGIQGYETTYRVIARKGTTIIELQAEDLGPYGARGLTPGVDPPAALATLANLLLARL